MKKFLMSIVLTASMLFMPLANFRPESLLRLSFVRNAEADHRHAPDTPLGRGGGTSFDV